MQPARCQWHVLVNLRDLEVPMQQPQLNLQLAATRHATQQAFFETIPGILAETQLRAACTPLLLLLLLLLLPTLSTRAGLTEAMAASWQSQWLFSASSNVTDLDEPSDICLHSVLSRLSKPKRVLCASASCFCSSATCPRVLPLPYMLSMAV
jgi:hypothetical protein